MARQHPSPGPLPVSRLWTTPSKPGLAPQTAEPLAPIPSTLHLTLPPASPYAHRILTLDNIVIYGVDTARIRWGYGGIGGG
jgi:hypothetical protein